MAAAKKKRRTFTRALKVKVVSEALRRGPASLKTIADRHGVQQGSLSQWIALHRAGKLPLISANDGSPQPEPRNGKSSLRARHSNADKLGQAPARRVPDETQAATPEQHLEVLRRALTAERAENRELRALLKRVL